MRARIIIAAKRAIIIAWKIRKATAFGCIATGLYERETGTPRWFMHGVFP